MGQLGAGQRAQWAASRAATQLARYAYLPLKPPQRYHDAFQRIHHQQPELLVEHVQADRILEGGSSPESIKREALFTYLLRLAALLIQPTQGLAALAEREPIGTGR